MEIEELCTKFTADLSDFRKKMETFTNDLKKVSGVTENLRKDITNAMNSPCDKVRKLGKEMSSLADKQIKISETIVSTKSKFKDYEAMLAAIQQKSKAQREEMQKLIDKCHKLTAVQKEQQQYLAETDGGIEGVRNARKEITDYIHDMSSSYGELKKKVESYGELKPFDSEIKQLNQFKENIQRAKDELNLFDSQLIDLHIDPEKLGTQNFSLLGKEIESLRNKISTLKQSEMSLSAEENSLNSVMANTAVKLENLKNKAAAGADSLNAMQSRLKTASSESSKANSKFSRFSSTISKTSRGVLSFGKSALTFLKNKFLNTGKSATDLSSKILSVTKSIKRIGVVALGLKMVKSIFGELRSVVSNYIQSNEKLNSKVEALKNSLGNALAPVIQLITGLLEKLMPYVISVTNAISDLLSSLGISTALQSTSSAVDGVTDSTKKLSKAQSDLYGFDKITKVGDNSSDSSSDNNSAAGNESISASKKLTEYLNNLKKLWQSSDFEGVGSTIAGSFNKVISKINALDWKGIQDKVNGTVAGITKSLNGFIHDFDWEGSATVLANGINTVIGGLYTIVSNLDWKDIGSSLAKGLNSLVSKIDWAKAGKTIGDAIKGLLDLIVKFLEDTDWQELGRKLAVFLKNIDWSGITSSLCKGLGAALGGLAALLWGLIEDAWNNVVAWWKDVAFEDGKFTMEGMLNGIGNVLSNIGTWIKEHIFQPFIDGFKKAFGIHSPAKEMEEPGKQIWNGVLEGIKNAIANVKEWVQKNIFDKVQKAFDTAKQIVMNIGAKISDSFTKAKEKWDSIKEKGKSAVTTIKGSVQNTFTNLKSKWDSIKSKTNTATVKGTVSNAFNNAKSKWDKLKSKTVTVTAKAKDKATETFKKIANSFIGFINKAINKINSKLKISIGSTLSKVLNAIGVKVSNGSYQLFSIPNIPMLETGGIVSKPTVAMVGEHGKEAVMPLENNTGWITQLAYSIASIMGNNQHSSNQGQIIIPIYIGSKHLTDIVIDDVNKRTKATGNCPIKI